MSRDRRRFSREFKIKVVQAYESGVLTVSQIERIGLHRPGWNRPELHADPIDRIGTETTEALPLLSVAETTNVTTAEHCP